MANAEIMGRNFFNNHPTIEKLEISDQPFLSERLNQHFVKGWLEGKENFSIKCAVDAESF